MKLTIGFSPCPNDTFIFDAIANKRINLHGLDFDIKIADIENLNQMAINEQLDIIKTSVILYCKVWKKYQILTSGAALGYGNGPLLVAKKHIADNDIQNLKIAIPGAKTTANFLLGLKYPNCINKIEYLYSQIAFAILDGHVDAGILIHETRFSYKNLGLIGICDLGEFWQTQFHCPIPLGAILIKRNLPDDVKMLFNNILKNSVLYALENRGVSRDYVKCYSKELSDEIIDKHISMFVNNFSIDLGDIGKYAIVNMCKKNGHFIETIVMNGEFYDNSNLHKLIFI